MGSNTSKTSPEPAAPSQKNDSDKDNPDPRSPTPEITRTPLQVFGIHPYCITIEKFIELMI